MKVHPAVEAACPLAAIDRRLADAHKDGATAGAGLPNPTSNLI